MPPWWNTWDRSSYRKRNLFWLHCVVVSSVVCEPRMKQNMLKRNVNCSPCEDRWNTASSSQEAGLGGRGWKQDRPSTHSFELRPPAQLPGSSHSPSKQGTIKELPCWWDQNPQVQFHLDIPPLYFATLETKPNKWALEGHVRSEP